MVENAWSQGIRGKSVHLFFFKELRIYMTDESLLNTVHKGK